MQLAKVVGNLVSTHKHKKLIGYKFMFVQPLDEELQPFGDELVAVDAVGAGVGDIVVLMTEGGSSRLIANAPEFAPIEVTIGGIVDSLKTKSGYKKFK